MLMTALSRAVFKACHGNQLVYNTCWEDPRLDRVALELGPGDRLLVITSAGCNALDYALDEPERIDTVDVNLRQNALLDLKLAAIRKLDYETFFEIFGRGKTDRWKEVYGDALRGELSVGSRTYWDKCGKFFHGKGRRPSFYFRGSSGTFASGINWYIDRRLKIRKEMDQLLSADTIEEQKEIYESSIKPAFWGPGIKWIMRRDAALSLLGVPQAQRQQLERFYPGGIAKFVEDSLDTVFSQLPIKDNYFWRVYLTGEYTPECCPEYLKADNFARLKGTNGQPGLAGRIHTHTSTILEHLKEVKRQYSHFVLLDHMDWMAENMLEMLGVQWQTIVDHADDDAKILWRSAAVVCEFVDPIEVNIEGKQRPLGEVLEYNRELADELHAIDRVHTYGGFSIATLRRNGVAKETNDKKATHGGNQSTQDAVPSDPVSHPG